MPLPGLLDCFRRKSTTKTRFVKYTLFAQEPPSELCQEQSEALVFSSVLNSPRVYIGPLGPTRTVIEGIAVRESGIENEKVDTGSCVRTDPTSSASTGNKSGRTNGKNAKLRQVPA